ncbi:hypothetical protein CYMTET_42359, partial [Cymbomonas tetramitiformis]
MDLLNPLLQKLEHTVAVHSACYALSEHCERPSARGRFVAHFFLTMNFHRVPRKHRPPDRTRLKLAAGASLIVAVIVIISGYRHFKQGSDVRESIHDIEAHIENHLLSSTPPLPDAPKISWYCLCSLSHSDLSKEELESGSLTGDPTTVFPEAIRPSAAVPDGRGKRAEGIMDMWGSAAEQRLESSAERLQRFRDREHSAMNPMDASRPEQASTEGAAQQLDHLQAVDELKVLIPSPPIPPAYLRPDAPPALETGWEMMQLPYKPPPVPPAPPEEEADLIPLDETLKRAAWQEAHPERRSDLAPPLTISPPEKVYLLDGTEFIKPTFAPTAPPSPEFPPPRPPTPPSRPFVRQDTRMGGLNLDVVFVPAPASAPALAPELAPMPAPYVIYDEALVGREQVKEYAPGEVEAVDEAVNEELFGLSVHE